MILDEELARTFRIKILQAVFGEDWRPDKPLENIGAELQILLAGHDTTGYARRAGHLQGLLDALRLFDESMQEANQTGAPQ